jgi:hypothetical protein
MPLRIVQVRSRGWDACGTLAPGCLPYSLSVTLHTVSLRVRALRLVREARV